MITPISDRDFVRLLAQRFSHLAEDIVRLVIQLSRTNGKPVSSLQRIVVDEILSWPNLGVGTIDAIREALSCELEKPRFFFSVAWSPRGCGVDPVTVLPRLLEGGALSAGSQAALNTA